MKRIIMVLALTTGVLGLIMGPAQATNPGIAPVRVSIPVPTIPPAVSPAVVPPISGCGLLASWFPDVENGLTWSNNYVAFRTPMMRAGTCRHVYVQNRGVTNTTSACQYMRVDTHNEDGSRRVRGPWVRVPNYMQVVDLRYPIDANRLFLVLTHSCTHRDSVHWTGHADYAV